MPSSMVCLSNRDFEIRAADWPETHEARFPIASINGAERTATHRLVNGPLAQWVLMSRKLLYRQKIARQEQNG